MEEMIAQMQMNAAIDGECLLLTVAGQMVSISYARCPFAGSLDLPSIETLFALLKKSDGKAPQK